MNSAVIGSVILREDHTPCDILGGGIATNAIIVGGNFMIMGMPAYTFIHVVISLVAIASGIVALLGFLSSRRYAFFNGLFLVMTVLTCLTGFGFPFVKLLPSHIVGIITLVFSAVAIFALYRRHLAGNWRWIYVAAAGVALYLNVFVLVFQAFLKVPSLNALAPTQSETPFKLTQVIVLAVFALLTLIGTFRFRPQR
jgi:hypothetical protein